MPTSAANHAARGVRQLVGIGGSIHYLAFTADGTVVADLRVMPTQHTDYAIRLLEQLLDIMDPQLRLESDTPIPAPAPPRRQRARRGNADGSESGSPLALLR